jgi:hypothetical protein
VPGILGARFPAWARYSSSPPVAKIGDVVAMIDRFTVEVLELVVYNVEYDENDPSNRKINSRRRAVISNDCNKDARKRFYKSLAELKWLAPPIHYAILKELGTTRRTQQIARAEAKAATLHDVIQRVKKRMRKNGERPREGIHEAAVIEIAEQAGMTVVALKMHLARHLGDKFKSR